MPNAISLERTIATTKTAAGEVIIEEKGKETQL